MGEAKKRGNFNERKNLALSVKANIELDNENYQNTDEQELLLYRYFNEERYAESFLNGNVWISTLQKCREYEDPQQGDLYEASTIYNHKPIRIQNRIITKEEVESLNHAGISLGVEAGEFVKGPIDINNNTTIRQIFNSFILCTTTNPNHLQSQSNEWRYDVKINLPYEHFHTILTREMMRKFEHFDYVDHGYAIYNKSRYYSSPNNIPDNIMFLKPNFQEKQSEYRFVWKVKDLNNYGDGILLECSDLKPFMERLY